MKYIVVDLEMHPIGHAYQEERAVCRQEIIEVGAVMLDGDYHEIDSYKTYVRPLYCPKILPKYQQLTGITTEDVLPAPDFVTVFRDFCGWCDGCGEEYEVYAWSESDYVQVEKELILKRHTADETEQRVLERWKDFQKEFVELLGAVKLISLEQALTYAGMDFDGRQHDALWDARNTARLIDASRNEEEFKKNLKHVAEAFQETPFSSCLGDLFNLRELVGQ